MSRITFSIGRKWKGFTSASICLMKHLLNVLCVCLSYAEECLSRRARSSGRLVTEMCLNAAFRQRTGQVTNQKNELERTHEGVCLLGRVPTRSCRDELSS